MTSYKNKSPLSSDLPRGSLENLYEKIRDLKAEFQHVEEKMRTAVESLPQTGGGGYYPGKFTEKMERRGLAGDTGCSSGPLQDSKKYCSTGPLQQSQTDVQTQEGRGTVLASWTPWPPWSIRWEKVRRRGDRKVEVQILSCEASVVEYQLS